MHSTAKDVLIQINGRLFFAVVMATNPGAPHFGGTLFAAITIGMLPTVSEHHQILRCPSKTRLPHDALNLITARH